MKKIGIVSNDKYINKIAEDINIKKFLNSMGYKAEIISWEDENINYSDYSSLLLRSVWGYQHNYDKFIKWLDMLENNNITIFNDVATIKSNIRKDIQFKILDKYNIPHIKTIFQKESLDLKSFMPDYIVKPIISGSGDNTTRIKDANIEILNKIISENDNGIMIQPYEKTIGNGEYSIIFIDGFNTHNMLRYPGIFYKKERPRQLFDVPKKVLDLAYKVKNIPEYKELLYMRIDIVDSNNPKIMEVELAEPDLLTRNIDSHIPIGVLCNGIIRRIK